MALSGTTKLNVNKWPLVDPRDDDSGTDTASEEDLKQNEISESVNRKNEKNDQVMDGFVCKDRECWLRRRKWSSSSAEQQLTRVNKYLSSMRIADDKDLDVKSMEGEESRAEKSRVEAEEEGKFDSFSECEYSTVGETMAVSDDEDVDVSGQNWSAPKKIGKRTKDRSKEAFHVAYVNVDGRTLDSSEEYHSDLDDGSCVVPQKRFATS